MVSDDDGAVRVSVIVPVWNEQDRIVRCLEALQTQTVLPFEVIVVDNMSTDSTIQQVRSMEAYHVPVHVLEQNERQGLIPTRDRGFTAARGDVLARIDADTLVCCDWVQQLTTRFM